MKEEYCGFCRWFKYKEPASTGGRCYVLPNKVERNFYEPGCSLYAPKDQQQTEEIKGGCNGLGN